MLLHTKNAYNATAKEMLNFHNDSSKSVCSWRM